MAQLSDDCFAFGGKLMTTDEALELLASRIVTVAGRQTLPLRKCPGRFLAADVVAAANVPPHDNSAVDGYAVHAADLASDTETRLPVTGRAAAGHPLDRLSGPGEAIRIFTGAPMPTGPDTVMMQEDCRAEEVDGQAYVTIRPGITAGANRRLAGEDIARGTTILTRGVRLRAQDIGLAASAGLTRLQVYRPLKVALMSTGDEIREPGKALPAGCVYDANRYVLLAALQGMHCDVRDYGILPDRFDVIRDTLAAAADECDLVITSGGVSVGEEDHVKAAVETLGSLNFWRLAIKPGRPLAMGQIGAVPFVGLPGNPVAVMVTFLRFARPLILQLSGCTDLAPNLFPVRSGFDHKKKKDRREFVSRAAAAVRGWWPGCEQISPRRCRHSFLAGGVRRVGRVAGGTDEIDSGSIVNFLPFSEVLQ